MENNVFYFLDDLMHFIQGSSSSTSDYYIAREMVTHFSSLHEVKIEEVAYRANVSTSAITKFIQKLGYKGFNEVKKELTTYFRNKNEIDVIKERFPKEKQLDAFLIYDSQITHDLLDHLKDKPNILKLQNQIAQRKRICLISPNYIKTASFGFANAVFNEGILCYVISRDSELELIKELKDEVDIFIVISSSGVWINKNDTIMNYLNALEHDVFFIGSNSISTSIKQYPKIHPILLGEKKEMLNMHFTSTRYYSLFFVYLLLSPDCEVIA